MECINILLFFSLSPSVQLESCRFFSAFRIFVLFILALLCRKIPTYLRVLWLCNNRFIATYSFIFCFFTSFATGFVLSFFFYLLLPLFLDYNFVGNITLNRSDGEDIELSKWLNVCFVGEFHKSTSTSHNTQHTHK